MAGKWWRQWWHKTSQRTSQGRARLAVSSLEDRTVPASANVVVDFDGGATQKNSGYLLPFQTVETDDSPFIFNYSAFQGFFPTSTNFVVPVPREQQIDEIMAGIREDWAPFDVNVIHDDRGVNSPYFRPGFDTVLMIVGDTPDAVVPGLPVYGIASSVDYYELQRIRANGATGGTFTLQFTHNGVTAATIPLPFDAPAGLVNAALLALPNIGFARDIGNGPSPNVVVEDDLSATGLDHGWLVSFWNDLGGIDVEQLEILTSLTGPAPEGVATTIFEGGIESRRDVAFAFEPSFVDPAPGFVPAVPAVARQQIRKLIDTSSHEIGHTMGLSHAALPDSQNRQIVARISDFTGYFASNNPWLDSRFSPEPLVHLEVEYGKVYAETARLIDGLGANPIPVTDTMTSQTLMPPPVGFGGPADSYSRLIQLDQVFSGAINGTIDFVGDRDGFRVNVPQTVRPNTRVTALIKGQGALQPKINLFNDRGEWIAEGVKLADGSVAVTIIANPGDNFFVTTGAANDNVAGSPLAPRSNSNTGNYSVTVRKGGLTNFVALGADAGNQPEVVILDAATTNPVARFNAYDPAFRGGVRVALGDINKDGYQDIITATGPGGGPHIKVFDGRDFRQLFSFFAYDPSFTGGVNVSAGDTNADGYDDIITGAGPGGGPHVKVFSGYTLQVFGLTREGTSAEPLQSFFAYTSNVTTGVTVASGDLFAQGFDQVVTGVMAGGGPNVRVFGVPVNNLLLPISNPERIVAGSAYIPQGPVDPGDPFHTQINDPLQQLDSFYAYGSEFVGGVNVTVGDMNADGFDDIVTGAGIGGSPHVKVFDGSFIQRVLRPGGTPTIYITVPDIGGTASRPDVTLASFFAYDTSKTTGVHLGLADVTGDGRLDVLAAPASYYGSFYNNLTPGNPVVPYPYTFGTQQPTGFIVSNGSTGLTPNGGSVGNLSGSGSLLDNVITGADTNFSAKLRVYDGRTFFQVLPEIDPGLQNGIFIS